MKKVKIFALVIVCLTLALTLVACFGHIEDTNGDEDFSLVTITDDDLINGRGNFLSNNSTEFNIGGVTTLKYGKMSGVTTLETVFVVNSKTITTEMTTTSGNCRLVLVHNNEIVYDFNINGSDSYTMQDSGSYYLRLAGESAKVSLLKYSITD